MALKYERVANDLRAKIKTAPAGERLPGEQRLREIYGVSLPVVRQALDTLESEGLVDRVHGRGTYVRAARQRQRLTPARLPWHKAAVSVVDYLTARPPTPDEMESLNLSPGVSVLVLRRVSLDAAGEPLGEYETVLPGDRTELVYTTNL